VLAEGLRAFSATRQQVRWGIPAPDAPGEVLYVWVEALANYLTGVGFPDDRATFERYWPADLHLIGKEITRFHCLYWPALLLSAGLPLPRHVFAHGWLTRDGEKISKSTGNVVDPAELATTFGSDAVRYFFVRAIPFGLDGDYTRQAFVARYNADLANDFGNLVQRATALAGRSPVTPRLTGDLTTDERELREAARELSERVEAAFETYLLHAAAAAVGEFVTQGNRYLERTTPWLLARQGATDRLAMVLGHAVEAARLAAWHYAPIIPRAASEAHVRLSGGTLRPGGGTFGAVGVQTVVTGPPLFPRLLAKQVRDVPLAEEATLP
jgi:methionyl-tRNA synthetase